ncbi:hypothetical protein [Lactococcus lactis]|uniref:Uncharacterized protein n=1 Tax=Lactococcus lactis TaxID=1358 RepID=A0AAP3Z123_9LACT|nr:hypothetical protein [Lactococcus lactis]MDG4968236.1 hypothetical protein [Lactococcus lactis]MDG4976404.1 hypothetical protein [Lactococcus lactis]MDG5102208.1 hypothetical protein [Lactococcus lactis]
MTLVKTWLIVIIVSLIFFYVGMLEGSMITLFIGAVGLTSGTTCGLSNLLVMFIKRK